jgi:hypothetical protein
MPIPQQKTGSDDLEELARLRKQVAAASAAAERAVGAQQEVLARLKREFGCTDIKAAQRKLKELEREEQQSQAAFRNALEKYKADFGGQEDQEDED